MPTLQSSQPQTQDHGGETSSYNHSVTVNAGTNRCLAIVVCGEGDGTAAQAEVSAISRNGQSLARLARAERSDWSWVEIWYVVAPNIGTFDAAITLTEADRIIVASYVSDDVDQSTPLRTAATSTGSGTSASSTVSGVASSDLLFDGLCVDATGHAIVQGADQTETMDIDDSESGHEAGSSTQSGANGGVMSWTWTTSAPYSHVATGFIAPAAAPTTLAPQTHVVPNQAVVHSAVR